MKYKILIIIIAVIFLLGAGGSLFVLFYAPKSTVEILSDGKVVETLDLRTAEDRTITVEFEGRTNTIEIKGGRIRVSDADCFDHTCMRMGYLSSAAMPIVCLPNHLVIAYSDSAGAPDAVTR